MSDETFESLFHIGVETEGGISALGALGDKLELFDAKILRTLDVVNQLNAALRNMQSAAMGSRGPVAVPYIEGVQPGLTQPYERGSFRSLSGEYTSRASAMAELAAIKGSLDEIVTLTDAELAKIPLQVRAKMQMAAAEFDRLKAEVVSQSIIPDMVREINAWLDRIDTEKVGAKFQAMLNDLAYSMGGLMSILSNLTGDISEFGELPLDFTSDFVPSIQRNIAEITDMLGRLNIAVPKALPVSQSISPDLWWQGTDVLKQLKIPYTVKKMTRDEMLEQWGNESGIAAAGVAQHYVYPGIPDRPGSPTSRGGRILYHEEAGGLELTGMMHEITHAFSYTIPREVREALHGMSRSVLSQMTTFPVRSEEKYSIEEYLGTVFGKGYDLPEEVLADAGKQLYGGTPAYPVAAGAPMLYEDFAQDQFQSVQDHLRRMMSVMDIESVASTLQLGAPSITPERFDVIAHSMAAWERGVGEMLSERLPRLLTEASMGMFESSIVQLPDLGSFEGMWPTAAAPTIEGDYTLLEGVGDKAAAELGKIPTAAAEATTETYEHFEKLSTELVGASLIIDMVEAINEWLARIGVPESVLAELEATAQRIQDMMDFPGQVSWTPMYQQGVQAGWDPATQRWKDLSGSFISGAEVERTGAEYLAAQADIAARAFEPVSAQGAAMARMSEERANQMRPLIGGWPELDPEQYRLAQLGSRATIETQTFGNVPLIAGPSITATGKPGGVSEEYVNGELISRLEEFNEQVVRMNELEEVTSVLTRKTTTALDGKGEVVRKVTREEEDFADGGESVVRTFKEMGDAAEEAEKKTSLFGNRFFRHLAWIGQGILIWQGIRLIQDLGRAYIQTFSDMEQSAARAAFVVQESMQSVREAQLQTAAQAAPYGVQPTEAAQAGLVSARYGVRDADFMRRSAELAMVAQMDMAQSTEYLMSIERTWNMGLDDTGRVLNTLATMYRMTPRSMQELLDVMREGPSLAAQFGQSFEENMLMISKALTYVPTQTPAGMFSLLQRTINRIFTGETPQILSRRYGVGVIDPETLAPRPGLEVFNEIAAKYRELQTEQEKTALSALIAGTRQGQAWADAKILLDNWTNIGMRDAQDALGEWERLSGNVAETTNNQVRSMKAEWGLLIQEIGDATGAAEIYRNVVVGTREALERGRRGMEIGEGGLPYGYSVTALERLYQRATGTEAREPMPWYQPLLTGRERSYEGPLTQEFLDWAERFLLNLEGTRGARGGRGYAAAARERGADTYGEFRGQVDEFGNSVRTAADYLREMATTTKEANQELSTWAAMLQAGWAPPTAIVDLTGPEESPYTAAQINDAIRQSRADTQAMIAAYRTTLEGMGLGEVAIAEALKNFTDNLEMQLQFYRLPGGEIRLMEGRDLLFYLSQIEENTRPLEGIWNVPEGMRVWVPIESTFYGEWRQRQQEGAGGEGEVVLDSRAFESAAERYGRAVDAYRSAVDEFKAAVARQAELMGQEDTTYIPEIGWPYSAEEPLPPAWLIAMEEDVRSFGNHVMSFGEIVGNIYQPEFGYPYSAPEELQPQWLLDMQAAIAALAGETPAVQPLDVSIPTPLDVNVNQSAITAGVQSGMMSTGMPMATSSMSTGVRALQTYGMMQLFWLSAIARNTSIPPTVNVSIEGGGASGGGGGGGTRPPQQYMSLTREWALSNGVYEVP